MEIEWLDKRFSFPGDSGKQVFIVINRCVVAVGIHVMCRSEKRKSYGLLLGKIFKTIEAQYDMQVLLCRCEESAPTGLQFL